jgi:CelD/BcsL family acetyltransferase involved in cellulose biosynthesis
MRARSISRANRLARSEWTYHWLTSWDEIWAPAFVLQWQAWMDASRNSHVFFHPSLVRAWCDTYRGLRRIEPRFLIAQRGSEDLVLYPLVLDHGRWKDGWLRVLCPVGSNEYDYHDPIFVGESGALDAEELCSVLLDAVHHSKIGADWLSIPRIRETSSPTKLPCQANRGAAPYISLNAYSCFEDLLAKLHKQLRQELRRQPGRLEQLGPLQLRVFAREETAAAVAILPAFLESHKCRWPGAYRPASFHENLIRHGVPSGVVQVSTLDSCERAISWHIGFVYRERSYYYLPAFDKRMANYSPGKVHLSMLIKDAFDRGAQLFDLLCGDEAYKMRWADGSVNLLGVEQRISGVNGMSRSGLRFCLRYAAKRLRPQPS